MTQAFDYIKAHGIMNTSQYAYIGRDGTCKAVDNSNNIDSYTEIHDCTALASQIGTQPISVAVDASSW
jgi:hypothetical protein